MQYSILEKEIVKTNGACIISESLFDELIRCTLYHAVEVDELYYLTRYTDVAKALKKRKIKSAKEHYVLAGYFESRLPRKIMVDERYYFEQNPDVEVAVKSGELKSAQDHFEIAGYAEGRLPFKGFSLISRS